MSDKLSYFKYALMPYAFPVTYPDDNRFKCEPGQFLDYSVDISLPANSVLEGILVSPFLHDGTATLDGIIALLHYVNPTSTTDYSSRYAYNSSPLTVPSRIIGSRINGCYLKISSTNIVDYEIYFYTNNTTKPLLSTDLNQLTDKYVGTMTPTKSLYITNIPNFSYVVPSGITVAPYPVESLQHHNHFFIKNTSGSTTTINLFLRGTAEIMAPLTLTKTLSFVCPVNYSVYILEGLRKKYQAKILANEEIDLIKVEVVDDIKNMHNKLALDWLEITGNMSSDVKSLINFMLYY